MIVSPCSISVDSLSVVDMDEGARYSKLVSLAEGTNKVSSFKVYTLSSGIIIVLVSMHC